MIRRNTSPEGNRAAPGGGVAAGRSPLRSVVALTAVGFLAATACQSSSPTEEAAVSTSTAAPTTTTAQVEAASATSTTAGDDIDPSLVGSLTGDSPFFPDHGNGGYDVSVYDWNLALSDDLTTLAGTVTITASATQDLQRFSLDARDLQVASVTVDDVPAQFSLEGRELIITASDPLSAGSDFVVEVDYSAEPDDSILGNYGDWRVVPGEQLWATAQAASWTPLDLDDGGPPTRYILGLDAPDGFTATGIGVPAEDDGSGRLVWDTRRPVHAFEPLFAVAEFDTNVVDWEVPVEVSLGSDGPEREQFEATLLDALSFVESVLGPYPYERLGISVLDLRREGWSSPTRIVVSQQVSESQLIILLAYQWAGSFTTDQREEWLPLGLGVYVDDLWAESLTDDTDATTNRMENRVGSTTRPLDQVESVGELADGTAYYRSALLYHALRLEIGDEAFYAALREFIQRNLDRHVTVADLRAVAEETSGQDLDQFFTSWVSEPDVPEIPRTAT